MRSRLLRFAAALIVGVVGTAVLLAYVRAAQDRAVAAEQTVPAFTVSSTIAAGTPIDQIATQVARTEVPVTLATDAQVRDLTAHAGTVATVELVPGELLVTSRLATPEQLEAAGDVDVPDDHHQVSFSLDPQRVAGGQLETGTRVGVFVSLEDGEAGGRTRLVLDDVLVTTVQRDDTAPAPEDGDSSAGPPPANNILVTLALPGDDAADAVFGAEFGRLWLSVQGPDAGGPRPLTTTESIFR